jgi:hypothetical protein
MAIHINVCPLHCVVGRRAFSALVDLRELIAAGADCYLLPRRDVGKHPTTHGKIMRCTLYIFVSYELVTSEMTMKSPTCVHRAAAVAKYLMCTTIWLDVFIKEGDALLRVIENVLVVNYMLSNFCLP